MRKNPRIEFNLEKLQHNVTTIYHMCAASSDHWVVDVTDATTALQIGDEIQFIPTYPGILSSTTSKYVKVYTN